MSKDHETEDCGNCGCVDCIIELAKELYIRDFEVGTKEPRNKNMALVCLAEADAFFRAVAEKYPSA